jgi:hypothetical protein
MATTPNWFLVLQSTMSFSFADSTDFTGSLSKSEKSLSGPQILVKKDKYKIGVLTERHDIQSQHTSYLSALWSTK